MKRVYETVATTALAGGHGVLLGTRVLKTPGQRDLAVPAAALARAIAAEWDAQHDDIRPAAMPLTRLAATALDRVAAQRGPVADEIAAYAGTDLVCYRAEHPPTLAARQHAVWQPLLDWAALRYDAPLAVTTGIVPRPQAPDSLLALARAVAAHDDFRLTALHAATAACGSLVIGLALCDARIDAAAAFAAAQLDENFQIEAWGLDAEAESRRSALAADLAATRRFLDLLDAPAG